MQRFLSVISFILLPFITAKAQDLPYDPAEYIEWNAYHKLTWDMFQLEVADSIFGDAGTSVKISAQPYLVGRDVYYDVYALFSKKQSWCKKRSDHLLRHEQLHFDIAELTARQIRQAVQELREKKVRDGKTYNRIIQKILDDSEEIDKRYDFDTMHGAIKEKQERWSAYVEKELVRLEAYRSH